MQPEQQQRIMGYFIEEAKDHLNTIEQGLLNLQSTIEDQEMVDEVFRAAHSVKGGAAMLGINSIQTTAHRLEDCFKLLRECPIKVDQKLETLFLRVCDALKELLEQLQRPFGLADEASNSIMSGVEPVFEELNTHLGALLRAASIHMFPEASTTQTVRSTSSLQVEEGILLPQTFEREVLVQLREMLQIFKQKDQTSSRQQLQEICIYLEHLADNYNLTVWSALLETARLAVANEENSYRTLANVVIKEIKQAQELASQGLADQIRVSAQLRSLLPPVSSGLLTLEQGMNEDQYSSTSSILNRQFSPSDPSAISLTSSLGYSDTLIQPGTDLENMRDESGRDQEQTEINPNAVSHITRTPPVPEEITTPTSASSEELDYTSDTSNYEQGVTLETAVNSQVGEQSGPEVGLAELNSLADLFEGEAPDLDDTWQEEEIMSPTLPEQVSDEHYQVGVDSTSDFSDLLTQNYDSQPYSSSFAAQGDDLISLFGEDFSEETPIENGEQTDDLALPIDFEFENAQGQEQDFEFFTADSIDTEITIADEGVTQAQASDWLAMETVLDTNTDLSDFLEDSPATPAFGAVTAAGASTSDDLINLFEDSFLEGDISPRPDVTDALDFFLDAPRPVTQEGDDDAWASMPDESGSTNEPSYSSLFSIEASTEESLNENAVSEQTEDDLLFVWQPDSSSNSEQDDLRSLLDESTESTYDNDLDEMHPNFNLLSEEDLRDSFDFNNLFVDQSTAHNEHGLGDILESPHDREDEQELSHPTVAGADIPPLGDEEEASDLVASTDISFNWLEFEEQEILSLDDNLRTDSPDADLDESAITSGDVETGNSETHDTALQGFEALDWEQTSENLFITDDLVDLGWDITDTEASQIQELAQFPEESEYENAWNFNSPFDEILVGEQPLSDSDRLQAANNLETQSTPTPASNREDESTIWVPDEADEIGFSLDDTANHPFSFAPESNNDRDVLSEETVLAETHEAADADEAAMPLMLPQEEGNHDIFGLEPLLSSEFSTDTEEDLEMLFGAGAAGMTDSLSVQDENLFETEMASGWEAQLEATDELFSVEPPAPQAADDLDSLWESETPTQTTELAGELFTPVDEDWNFESATQLEATDELFSIEPPAPQAADDLDSLWESETPTQTTELAGELFTPVDEDWNFESATQLEATDELFSIEPPAPQAADDLDSLWESETSKTPAETEIQGFESELLSITTLDQDGNFLPDTELQHLEDLDAGADFEIGDEFTELEAILDEEPLPSDSEASVGDKFAELEELLDEEVTSVSVGSNADANEFDELEVLLNASLTPDTVGALEHDQSFERIAATSPSITDVDEFGDLEDMLHQADQKIGPQIIKYPDRRRPIRPVVFEQTMRVPVKHLDNLSNLVGELVVNRNTLEQDQERLRQFLDNLLHQVQQLSDVGARMQDLYERSLLESSLLASRHSPRSSATRGSDDRSHDTQAAGEYYDPLEMDRFTGFHLLSQEMIELIVRVRESAADIEFLVDGTDQVARMLRQVTTQLQEGLTRSRMVAFAQTADRLPRAVREISLKCGKQAELFIEGRDTLIDKVILEHLYNPMTHLVNNAITHGIELPEVRRAAGKSPVGRITVRAFHQGNQTVISLSDDGVGINVERVKTKAVEKGLITRAEAQSMSRLEVYDLLFHAGFSTADEVDDLKGRGVGMNVVLKDLTEIRGTTHIDSTPGKGTTFTIRLPLTLSICKALCCLSERARVAFPMDGVEDMMDLPKDSVQANAEGQKCIAWRDMLLPFQPLSELLKYNRQIGRGTVYGGNREDDMISIVVLRSSGNFIAIQVDRVLGEQEIVIKQLEGPIPKPVGVAGATVLGDGRIMPIGDVLELIDISLGRLRPQGNTQLLQQAGIQVPAEVTPVKSEPMVLIVDDSITVRELLSMTFSKAGYRVEQARDGQEAWDKLRSGLPCDIVFCDIEMPRMDGLELLSRLHKDVTLNHLPVAMLTSRGADRHRQMAAQLGASGYFTKPYLEEALLDAAQRMMRGEMLLTNNSNA